MLEKYEKEFSEIFSRLMRLQITLRERVLYSTEKIFGDNTYSEYNNFFINPFIYEQYDVKNKGNKILKIMWDKTVPNNHIKFIKLINSLYLSHLLDFVMTYKQFYQNKKLKELLYVNMPHTREIYLEALGLFEFHLGVNIGLSL